MINVDIKRWSERQQVLAIIVMAGLVIALLWVFLLLPKNNQLTTLENQIESSKASLAQKDQLRGEDVLEVLKREEKQGYDALMAEWTATVTRVTPFSSTEDFPAVKMGNIDFKRAFRDVSWRLRKKATSIGINLPRDLGMDETVRSDEDSRKLMLQLRTVEKLVDLALDLNLDAVKSIEAFPVVIHETDNTHIPYAEEYPVHMELNGSLNDLYSLLRGINKPGTVFILRHIKIEAPMQGKPDELSINCVMSALVFTKKPSDIQIKTKKAVPVAAAGH